MLTRQVAAPVLELVIVSDSYSSISFAAIPSARFSRSG